MADDDRIEPHDFASQLDASADAAANDGVRRDPFTPESAAVPDPAALPAHTSNGSDLLAQIMAEGRSFWAAVYEPFLNRDLNRAQVKAFVRQGLALAEGSYRRLVSTLRMPEHEYQRFMDFLRHHDLKP